MEAVEGLNCLSRYNKVEREEFMTIDPAYLDALSDFREARTRAAVQKVLARLTGKSLDLLPFDEITYKLRGANQSYRGLQDIPIDKIVGSVSRYADYTRDFLPLREADRDRWARVKILMSDPNQAGLPPIEVYKIGDAYFVKDGHHRVSVARQLKNKYIEGLVIEIQTKVPLGADESPEDLILKAEYADFLDKTHIDKFFPEAGLQLTFPGLYKTLEEHIKVHRYYMGLERRQEIPYEGAVRHWYETVYLPVVQAIREQGLLHEFPGRTETDLYVWISDHRAYLVKDLGWQVSPEVAAADLAGRMSPRLGRVFQRFGRRLYDAIVPEELEDGPSAQERLKELNPNDHLVKEILVPVDGEEGGWKALEQASILARREGANLFGLYILRDGGDSQQEKAREVKDQFEQSCQQNQVPGQLAVVSGEVAHTICERALLTDLVVLNLAHPPSAQFLERLSSGFRTILRRCARPVLAVPGPVSSLERLLLAYDGSPKGNEALFLAAYFSCRCCMPLSVVTVGSHGTLEKAKAYLQAHQVTADYLQLEGPVADSILEAARKQDSQMIIMGGYGSSPLVEVVLGSTVDEILRESTLPVLVCQ